MKNKLPMFLTEASPDAGVPGPGGGRVRQRPLERGIRAAAGIIKNSYAAWESASARGFFQYLDARVKLVLFASYVLLVSFIRTLPEQAALSALILVAVAASGVGIVRLYARVLVIAFFFGFLIALPASLNVITPGRLVLPLFDSGGPYELWLWRIPEVVGITAQGARGVGMLTLRVMNSVAIAFVLIYTTPFPKVARALRVFGVPEILVMTIALTYKYVFLLAQTVEDMHRARQSRLLSAVSGSEGRVWASGRVALVFSKTRRRSEELYKAMLARSVGDDVRARSAAPSARDMALGTVLLAPAIIWTLTIIGR